jgi:hypothetical protein
MASMGITPKWFTLGWTVFLALVGSLSPLGPTKPRENPRDGLPQQSQLESQQGPSPAVFWELQPAQVNAMLLPIPDGDGSRYQHLHQYFSDLHCPSKLMVEQRIPKHVGKNLMCVLPGKNAEQILVVARYDGRWAPGGWSDAVALPILYNALLAQPRQHTFVFAAISGSAGEKELFVNLRKNKQPAVKAIVVLAWLGMGEPRFYTPGNKLLQTEAAFTAHLQGISVPMNDPLFSAVSHNSLLSLTDRIPSILIHSGDFFRQVSAPAFHKDFDFVAYYLCRIDTKLVIPTNPPAH